MMRFSTNMYFCTLHALTICFCWLPLAGHCVPAEAIKACYRLSPTSLKVLRGVTEGMGCGKGISSKQQLLDWRPYRVQVPPPPKMDPAVEAKVHELMNIGYGIGVDTPA
jgi:hypothetical protein